MKDPVTTQFSLEIKRFQENYRENSKDENIRLILLLNSMVHCAVVSKLENTTCEDQIWDSINGDNFRIVAGKNRYSVAWNLWHCARIEDICSHAFISYEEQIFTKRGYQNKLNIISKTTGNEFTDNEMKLFNESINLKELKKYRNDVGIETRKIIKKINTEILSKKVNIDDLNKLQDEGYIGKGSEWLLEFWGRKKIIGIITMPLSRHILVHLNDCKKILKIQEK
jgi:hypothetical protein